jgi:hypothetical protein
MKGNKICSGSVLIVPRSYAIITHAAMGLPGLSRKKTGLGPTAAHPRREVIRSAQLDYYCTFRQYEIGSTSSQLWPAEISTLSGTDNCKADVITPLTSSANRGISAAGASNTSSS